MNIRLIQPQDNASIESIIRECLIEFGGNREGLAWMDSSLSKLHEFYSYEGRAYWVAEQDGKIVGGCGIAPFADSNEICELQKMYLTEQARGTGIASKLLTTALEFAKGYYDQCYLETLRVMQAANRFYEKKGFQPLAAPLAGSEHFACDAWYIIEFNH
ncbi:GNAT family N-acetyltransferase [Paenibacillus segetis]|uniref:N-acetyltransferase n=1 Tax=Paenibacillus segetis TaxID=1325360 RepID=A0ABQ1YFU9_9BACL|nr:GNAT family N-acetyltransferase [Paenibacillus segetis]GGH23143.1 N-acetyltransferase [Paenibacillus segetis]